MLPFHLDGEQRERGTKENGKGRKERTLQELTSHLWKCSWTVLCTGIWALLIRELVVRQQLITGSGLEMPDVILMGCSAEQTHVLGVGSVFPLLKLPIPKRLYL